ncbi:MAG: hypothetical protein WC509_02135 [Candidatus Izemoplasmatales bacterium]
MKKLLIILAMALALPLLGLSLVQADETLITSETRNFVPGNGVMTINGVDPNATNYNSTGYVALTMGAGNSFTFDVDALLEDLDYYDPENVSDAYILVYLGTYYTSAPAGFWNYTNSRVTTETNGRLRYQLDPENLSAAASMTVWWANQETSGGAPYSDTGGLRFYSATLVIEYATAIDTLVDVGTDYAALPDSINDFIRIGTAEIYEVASNSWTLTMIDTDETGEGTTYAFDVAIPAGFDISSIRFPDSTQLNISYTTTEEGDRVLYFQPDLSLPPVPSIAAGTVEDPADLLAGFMAMNLTTLEYTTVERLKLNGIVAKEANDNAYLYCFFPLQVEDLLSISTSFRYRVNGILGEGEWTTTNNIYSADEDAEVQPPLWLWWLSIQLLMPAIPGLVDLFDWYNVDQLAAIDVADLPSDVLADYVDLLEGDVADLDDLNLYRIHLGQFREFLSMGYDISNVVITNITYVYQGVVYEAAAEVIDQEILTPPEEGAWWTQLWTWLQENWQIVIGVIVAVVALVLLSHALAAVKVVLEMIAMILKAVIQGVGFVIKWIFVILYHVLRFLFVLVPVGVGKFLYYLVTPASKRRQSAARKDMTYYARRSV